MGGEKLAWGILGTGAIARKFARGVLGSETGRLAAVGSRTQAAAEAFGTEYAIPNRHGTYEALLADPAVQAVYIATPHPMHAEWAIKAAEALKHILCEKPLTINHATAMAVIEAARKHDVFLMEAFMYRCHPQIATLLELIGEGAIGEVRTISCTFSFDSTPDAEGRLWDPAFGGGGILDVGCYPMSMARLIAGAARGKPYAEPIDLQAVGHTGETHVDEYTAAVATFPGGIVAQLATGIHALGDNVVRIVGATGTIVLPDPWMPSIDGGETRIMVREHAGGAEQVITVSTSKLLYAFEADTVAAHIADRQAPAMPWGDTLGNMAALDRWRAALGLEYPMERAGAVPPVAGRPLAARGTMPAGTIAGIEKPVSRLVLGADNQRTISHASVVYDDFFERGGTCIDTAYVYVGGLSEQLLGQWLQSRGVREQVVVLDKGAHTPYCTPDYLVAQLTESLERLHTEYVDLYMMHRDNSQVPVGEFMDVLNEQVRAGRMRAFGVSNWSMARIDEARQYTSSRGLTGIAAISNNLSLADMVAPPWDGSLSFSDDHSRRWLERANLPLFPWSSQARGFFAGHAHPENHDDPELARSWYSPANFARLERTKELARRRGVLPINVALAYVLNQPFPTFPLIGPRTLDEMRIALRALDVTLTPDEVRWLRDGGSTDARQ